MGSKILANSIFLFLGMEFCFWGIACFGVFPVNVGMLIWGSSESWAVVFHYYFVLEAILYGLLQSGLYRRQLDLKYKYLLLYLLWWGCSIILGGLLFSYLDMKIGYFLSGDELINKLMNDQFRSFELGNSIILTSIPFNIIVISFSFFLLHKSQVLKNPCKKRA